MCTHTPRGLTLTTCSLLHEHVPLVRPYRDLIFLLRCPLLAERKLPPSKVRLVRITPELRTITRDSFLGLQFEGIPAAYGIVLCPHFASAHRPV
jgi:hypothetical protein